MAIQTFEKRLEKALLDAAKNGANVTYYNFAGANITGNIYINNGVPHVSKPTVEAPQKDTATQSKAKKQTKTEPTPVVVAPEVAEPVVFETESYENDEDSDNDQEEVTTETQDDSSQDDSQTSQEIQVTFDNDSAEDETHVYKRLTQINKTLSGSNKIKLKKKLAKCGDLFKDKFESAFILKVDSQEDSDVCNFKDLRTFEDVVNLLSVNL